MYVVPSTESKERDRNEVWRKQKGDTHLQLITRQEGLKSVSEKLGGQKRITKWGTINEHLTGTRQWYTETREER